MKNFNENLRKNMMRIQKMFEISFVLLGFGASLQASEYCARKSPVWAAYATDAAKIAEIKSDREFKLRSSEASSCGISDFRSLPLDIGVKKPQPKKVGEDLSSALARLDIKK